MAPPLSRAEIKTHQVPLAGLRQFAPAMQHPVIVEEYRVARFDGQNYELRLFFVFHVSGELLRYFANRRVLGIAQQPGSVVNLVFPICCCKQGRWRKRFLLRS